MSKYHETLGLKPGATEEEVKKAWKKLALQWHPDRNESEEAKTKIQEINEAYEILTGKKQAPREQNNSPFNGQSNPFGRNPFKMKARPITLVIDLTVEEVFNGVSKKIQFHVERNCIVCNGNGGTKFEQCKSCGGRGMHLQNDYGMQTFTMCNNCAGSGKSKLENCNTCKGQGIKREVETIDISIPKGSVEGSRMVITNAGNDWVGSNRGDVYLTIRVTPHPFYQIEGLNLHKTEELSFIDMVLGKEVEIESINGKFKITVPQNCDSNKVFRLKGQGISDDETGFIGDLYVKMVPKVPKQINEEEKELLLKLKETTNFS